MDSCMEAAVEIGREERIDGNGGGVLTVKHEQLQIGSLTVEGSFPGDTDILTMGTHGTIREPAAAIAASMADPLGCPPLEAIAEQKQLSNPDATAVVVISDNTRPVPYKGDAGILWPILDRLLHAGVDAGNITILVATGTHRGLTDPELRQMLDPRVFQHGIAVANHDCRNQADLMYLGETRRGSRIHINRRYMEADIKILTGLVESHFMTGVSGGRKSICPGLIGEESTYVFHGASMLDSPQARDLLLDGNPCHEEALEVARWAGADFIVNVTLDGDFHLTGVYAGDLELAHRRAAEAVQSAAAIPFQGSYDIVVTHGGLVGINHYQTAKAAVVALPLLHSQSQMILLADNSDQDPIGSTNYRTVLHLLTLMGAERFDTLLHSPDWPFIPEQWQVQMWARVLSLLPSRRFVYYSPQFQAEHYALVPGCDGSQYINGADGPPQERLATVLAKAVGHAVDRAKAEGSSRPRIAVLKNGPYGIPVPGESTAYPRKEGIH